MIDHTCLLNPLDAIQVWVDGVEGVVPGVGLPIRRHGLWQGTARGISLERLLHGGLPPNTLLDLLHNR